MVPTRFNTGSTVLLARLLSLLAQLRWHQVDNETDIITMYTEYPWGDLWQDAGLLSVLKYVRGSKQLSMPPCWREIFPTMLPPDEPDSP